MEQSIFTLPQLLNERQTAHLLACSVAALRRWRREGRGPEFTRVEGCIRYRASALERFVAQNTSVYPANRKAADSQSAAQMEMRDGHATLRR
jgi:hypothetical protein